MAVMTTVEIPGLTSEIYDGMSLVLSGIIRGSKGFISHAAGPIEGGWRVIEVWETQADADQFFAKNVHPNLPEGIKPRRTIQKLHAVIRPVAA